MVSIEDNIMLERQHVDRGCELGLNNIQLYCCQEKRKKEKTLCASNGRPIYIRPHLYCSPTPTPTPKISWPWTLHARTPPRARPLSWQVQGGRRADCYALLPPTPPTHRVSLGLAEVKARHVYIPGYRNENWL